MLFGESKLARIVIPENWIVNREIEKAPIGVVAFWVIIAPRAPKPEKAVNDAKSRRDCLCRLGGRACRYPSLLPVRERGRLRLA